MNLDEAKQCLEEAEPLLETLTFVRVHFSERNGRKLSLAITDRLRRQCKKGRVWKSKEMLTALKNVDYGFDPRDARSPGGRDGIFVLTRDHQPTNAMMRKVFDQFLDRTDSEASAIARELGVRLPAVTPVRLVSHHMRLLGLIVASGDDATLVLVDYDDTK